MRVCLSREKIFFLEKLEKRVEHIVTMNAE